MVIHLRVAVLVVETMIIPLLLRSLIMVTGGIHHLLHPRHLIITMESGTPRAVSQKAQSHGMATGGPNQTRARNLMDIGAEMDGGLNHIRAPRSHTDGGHQRAPRNRGQKLLHITLSQVGLVMVGSTSDYLCLPSRPREMDGHSSCLSFSSE